MTPPVGALSAAAPASDHFVAVLAVLTGLAFKNVLCKIEDWCDALWKGRPEWARPVVLGLALGLLLLALPVMLAVAIATTVSRALSYGTIYTTKLLRRGTDIDQAAPWRAVADLKFSDVMRPFRTALPVPPDSSTLAAADGSPGRDGAAGRHNGTAPPGPVTYQHDVQALFASESLGQALHSGNPTATPSWPPATGSACTYLRRKTQSRSVPGPAA